MKGRHKLTRVADKPRYGPRQSAINTIAILICIAMAGCGSPEPPQKVGIPNRIVSMVPNVTEILFALGLDSQIVGVSSFCDYPPEAESKSKIGGVLNPDIEAILFLQPDLVVNIPGNASENTIARLNDLNVPTLVVSTETINDTFFSIIKIGVATGKTNEAAQLVATMKHDLDIVQQRVANIPARKTLFVIGHSPLYVAGHRTFIDDVIKIAGGTNIAIDAIGQYPRFSIEEVIARAPDVIIDSTLGAAFSEKDIETRRKWWNRWNTLPAVRQNRIYGLDTDALLRPGPRMPAAALMVAKVIHPEIFQEDQTP